MPILSKNLRVQIMGAYVKLLGDPNPILLFPPLHWNGGPGVLPQTILEILLCRMWVLAYFWRRTVVSDEGFVVINYSNCFDR